MSTNTNITAILLVQQALCDHPEYSTQTLAKAWTLLAIKFAGLLPYFCILPATLRLAKHRTAFHILFQANLMHCIFLVRALILYLEYFFGYRVHFPLDIDAFILQMVSNSLNLAYILLAFNRLVAIFVPFKYEHICTESRIKMIMLLCWVSGVGFGLYFHHRPELRLYDCLAGLTIEFPPFKVQDYDEGAKVMADIGNYGLLLVSFLPTAIYLTCLIKMIHDWAKRNTQLHNIDATGGVAHASAPAPASDAIARAACEHTRLFLVCFLSTLPHLISSLLLMVIGQFEINRSVIIGAIYTHMDDMFHLQQPIGMLLLSTELQNEVTRDLRKFLVFFGIRKASTTAHTNAGIGPITAWLSH